MSLTQRKHRILASRRRGTFAARHFASGSRARSSPMAPTEIYQLPPAEATVAASPELPEDILMCIFRTLEIPDLVRAGSVSTAWYSAYITLRSLGKHREAQTPCLLYTSESAGDNVAFLYSLVEKKVYRMTLPDPPIRSRFLIGSSLGFLVTVDDRSEMHLVNPITGEQIDLPLVTTIPCVNPICDDSGAVHKYQYCEWYPAKPVCELRETFHFKAFVFHDDSSKGGFIVVLLHGLLGHFSYARLEDDKWTYLPLPPHTAYQYRNCTYKDGLLYGLTELNGIHAFDLSAPADDATMEIIKGEVDVAPLDVYFDYIVQAPWGDLLIVSRSIEFDDPDQADEDDVGEYGGCPAEIPYRRYTEEIKLYKLDLGTTSLVKIDCLPDHVLFLGHNHSLCLGAKEYPALKGNHAYFTDDDEVIARHKDCLRDIGVLDLGSNTKEDLVSPQLWSNWPAPMWIIPSLTMMKPTLNKEIGVKKV